jgi:hypothetical protein
MSRRLAVVLAVVAAALAVIAPAADAARPVPFMRGITIAEWGPTAYEPGAVARTLTRLHDRYGVDTVTLVVVWNEPSRFANTIAPGPQTVPTRNLVKAIRIARRLHIRVILRPYIDLGDGWWRGNVVPASPSEWWASYDRFILRFAALAQREGASGLVVGSELKSMSPQVDQWNGLVAQVRKVFTGFLTYQANWDENVTWWRLLDTIDISAYYPVASWRDYTVHHVVVTWQQWVTAIQGLRAANRGMPVMFGEIGYRSIRGAAIEPWNLRWPGRHSAEAQRRAYEAAFEVWYRMPWFRGFEWWYLAPQSKLVAGLQGADHQPLGPALRTVGDWYRKRR